MKTKLTLSIDKEVLKEAKKHFNSSSGSLSEIIEDYFKSVLQAKKKNTSIVKSTKGILAEFFKGKSYDQIKEERIRDKYVLNIF